MDWRPPARPYAPLMWLVTAMGVGYTWAEAAPMVGGIIEKTLLLVAAIVGAWVARKNEGAAAQKTVALRNVAGAGRWKLYAWVAAMVAASFYYSWAAARAEIPPGNMAPREALMVVQIKQRFALKEEGGLAAGVAVIVENAGDETLVGKKIAYSMKWKLPEPCERGQQVRVMGVVRSVGAGEGFEGYLHGQHIPYKLDKARALGIVQRAPWGMRMVESSRRWVIATLERGDPYGAGLLPAMVMGAKAELSKTQNKNFVRSGTYHLVAVSGMNVMVVAALLWFIGRAVGVPYAVLGAVVVAALYYYAQVTGATASVMRAWGMVALAVSATAARRQANLWPVVVLAAAGSLMIEPLSLWHGGWRLSFGVVAGMVLGMGAIERWAGKSSPKGIAGGILKALMVSLVAGIAVAPMTASYWGIAQPWGFVLNAMAVMLAGWVTLLGSVSIMLGWLPWVPEALNTVAGGIIWAIEWLIKAYLSVPGASVEVPWWPAWAGGVATLMILTILWAAAWKVQTRWRGTVEF